MDQRPKRKKPSDYPQFAFRLNSEVEKERLTKHIERTVNVMNDKIDADSKPFSKSEVIVKALTIGLAKLSRK